MGRKSHRKRPEREPFSWLGLQQDGAGVLAAESYEEMKAEQRTFRVKLDAKFGPGAGDELASRVIHPAEVMARQLGLPPGYGTSKTRTTWTLGRGYHAPQSEKDEDGKAGD